MLTSRWFLALLMTGVASLVALTAAPAAIAAPCSAPVRYAATSNRITVSAATESVTLSDIKRLCPGAPLQLLDASNRTWLLSADLVLDGGSRLLLDGAAGGDAAVLLLKSGSSGTLQDVASITAQHGGITLRDTSVRSHDPATGGPDTSTVVPTGGVRGRAFIRALSYMDGSTPKESRMDIVRSDIGHLGYNASESYGVAYKARGCGASTPAVCDTLSVRGEQVDSTFHDNYMGTYTWGAQDMVFLRNVYTRNVSYGLDPHDDSDFLTITGNTFSENGNHGLICSQRCNNLTITDNVSRDNGTLGTGEVHGIMLHRGITDSLVQNNVVSGNTTGGGIVLFDSVGNTVRNNRLDRNKYGFRFSVGSRGTLVTGNTVTGSLAHAVYTFKGSDAPVYSGTSGRPSDVTFDGNTFGAAGSTLFRVLDADRFTFVRGAVVGPVSAGPRFERSSDNVFDQSVVIPAGLQFTLRGTSTTRTSMLFRGMTRDQVGLSTDAFSTATFG